MIVVPNLGLKKINLRVFEFWDGATDLQVAKSNRKLYKLSEIIQNNQSKKCMLIKK